ncbi:hypothetical protein RB620_15800 [Paenibacillus sp. LHD-117]|uniref:hypothetical protein n=1 Tax=Paenibacillus sp. LHD-117 TaxID=3071412 RepID=UPI0027E14E58|nr:hypothetical protein [Paenibacillus sp. LHD-117]MDQ6420895.1 hypothetical protein [Paenibacillus sp. LHD-117]
MKAIFIVFILLLIGIIVISSVLKKGPQKHRSSYGGDAGFLHGDYDRRHDGDSSGNNVGGDGGGDSGGSSGGGDGGGGGGGGGD